jgi:hypothetical protein
MSEHLPCSLRSADRKVDRRPHWDQIALPKKEAATAMGGTELGPAALLLLSTAGKEGPHGPTFPSPRALIVEDEVFFAISLEADMHELGFDV